MEQLRCRGVAAGYGERTAVEDIDLTISGGDYWCIAGENGAGKSTLLRTLIGLLKPLRGEIVYSGDVSRKGIGYLPQQNAVQKDFPASAGETVLSGCLGRIGRRPFYGRKEKKRAAENMKLLHVYDLKNRRFSRLSGGQQQRVLLARALCAADDMLFLDEPVTGLDPGASEKMYGTLAELNEKGTTIVMVSHDIKSAKKYADHILYIEGKGGEVIDRSL